jgi:hypothetical protein
MSGANLTRAVLPEKQVITREQWRGLRSDIGEDEATDLLSFVGRMLDAVLERTVFRLGGLI